MATNNGVPIGGGFTEGELKFAGFWVRNRIVLKRVGYGALIAVVAVTWGYTLWGILDAYAISYPRESRLTQEIAANQVTLDNLQRDRPQNVATQQAMVFATTDNRYDMAVDLENSNAQWWPEFNYRFNLSGEQTPLRTGFIMPGSKTTLTELGYKPKARGGSIAQFQVENIRWHHTDPSVVGANYADFANLHFNVSFDNVKYDSSLIVGNRQIGRTSFDMTNRGSYGYWAMDVVVKLYRGANVIGVNRITLPKFSPGETRHVDIDWFDKLPSVTKTEIIPIINFLDPNSYLSTQQFGAGG